MSEDGVATQLPTDVRHDDEGVGFAFAYAELADVTLDVFLFVIRVPGIVEPPAARCFKVIDPCEPVPIDEGGVQAKSNDDQIFRRPADSAAEVFQVFAHRLGDLQTAGIVVAAEQQYTFLPARCPISEPPHHRRAGVEVGPTFQVRNRDVKLSTDRLKQIAQAELLGRDFDIDIEVIPETARHILFMGMVAQMVDQAFSFVGDVFAVDLLNTDGLARGVLGANVEREVS